MKTLSLSLRRAHR